MFQGADDLLAYVKDEGVEFIDIRFCDLPGIMQHFTVPVGTLPGGVYTWWAKGDHWLATSGTITLTGAATTPVELGLQQTGDVNNYNLVVIADFSLLRASFGKSCGVGG